MKFIKYLFYLALATLVIIFSVSNRGTVIINLFPFSYVAEIPVFVFFFISLLIGIVLAALVITKRSITRYLKIRSVEKEITTLKQEVDLLRAGQKITPSLSVRR